MEKVQKILVLYTGGTIGMRRNKSEECTSWNTSNSFTNIVKTFPKIYDARFAQESDLPEDTGALPQTTASTNRIVYTIHEHEILKESSNIKVSDWSTLTDVLQKFYQQYDGFVILHGTDTMAYTASALSFMLENLGKPVILTGSQIPIVEEGTDGIDNFFGAVYLAGQYSSISEVTLFFNKKLLRGNRSCKISSTDFDAFDSPNFPPLLTMREEDNAIKIDDLFDQILRTQRLDLEVHTNLSKNVVLLRVYPGMTPGMLQFAAKEPTEGLVLETYGAGHLPSDLLEELKIASERGVIILNCTQCLSGSVNDNYKKESVLVNMGVIQGMDLTSEAAYTKLSYVLSLSNCTTEEKRHLLIVNICGEMSSSQHKLAVPHR